MRILNCLSILMLGVNISSLSAQEIKLVAKEQEKRVDVLVDGKLFTAYIYPDDQKKPVLYPVLTANGAPVTRGWPLEPRAGERVDHPHHVGIWFNYGDVNGHDFWNNSNNIVGHKGPFGTIRHQEIKRMEHFKDRAELHVSSLWYDKDNAPLLREDTRFVFRAQGDERSIERTATLTALKEPVLFKDNKEGLFALRLARELEHPSDKAEKFTDASGKVTDVPVLDNTGVTGKYTSSEGKEGDAVWGTRAKWVALNGAIRNSPVTVVIIDHPKNPGYPSYWHARGYGLFAINSLGQEAMSNGKEKLNYSLKPGQSATFSYKMLINSGKHLSKEHIEKASREFAGK